MAKEKQSTREFTITRVFDAPRELVWRAWTDPQLVMRWWGPKEFTSPVDKIDLRVGGKYLFSMKSPDGQIFWSTGVYREIVPMERLVFTDSFADEQGNVVPATYYGLSADFPLETPITVTFADQGNQTKVTLLSAIVPDFEEAKAGWEESFDKLADLLQDIVRAEPGRVGETRQVRQ